MVKLILNLKTNKVLFATFISKICIYLYQSWLQKTGKKDAKSQAYIVCRCRLGVFIPGAAVEQVAVFLFAAFHPVSAPGAPLLKKESHALRLALGFDIEHPFSLYRPGSGAAFASHYHPSRYYVN